MTISIQDTKEIFSGNDSATEFAFDFKTNLATDLLVTLTDALGNESTLVLDTHYSVELNENQNSNPGGTVTYPISGLPLATGARLTVLRNASMTQPTAFTLGVSPRVLESKFDNLTMFVQQLYEKVNRTLFVSASDNATTDLGTAAQRADKIPKFDSSGNVELVSLVNATSLTQTIFDSFFSSIATAAKAAFFSTMSIFDAATEAMYALINPTTSEEIAAAVTITSRLYRAGNIRRYGAISGQNSRAAIQAAIDQCALGGADVYIPRGTWLSPSRINLKSNVRVYGEGARSIIQASGWTDTLYALIYADRSQAGGTPYVNIILEDFAVVGALNGGTPSHSNQGAAVLIAYAVSPRLRNIIVTQADDACIRMEGYHPDTVFPLASSDPDANSDLGHLTDFLIEGCRCTGGYMGLEIEGGASGQVIGGYFSTTQTYGIRMPRAQHVKVIGSYIHSTNDQALWMDYVNRSMVDSCTIISEDAGEPCVAIGYNKDVVLANNTIRGGNVSISDSVMHGSTISAGGSIVISNNSCDARIQHLYHQSAIVQNNRCAFVEFTGTAKGVIAGNAGTLTITAGKQLSEGGSDVLVLNNFTASTFLPRVDDGNYGLIGTADAAPTTGTYEQGHVIMTRTPSGNLPLGWVCTAGGTPGTWESFGEPRPNNVREFFVSGSATTVTDRALVTLTIPNNAVFIVVEALAAVHRAPNSSPSTSNIQRALFSIGRATDGDVVIDTYSTAGEFTKTSTTAGGANAAGTINLECARTGAEASTAPQAVAVRIDVGTGLRAYSGHIRVIGAFNGTTFARG